MSRLHYAEISRMLVRLSEISVRTRQASCRFLRKFVFSRLLPQISIENRSPHPVLKHSLMMVGLFVLGWPGLVGRTRALQFILLYL